MAQVVRHQVALVLRRRTVLQLQYRWLFESLRRAGARSSQLLLERQLRLDEQHEFQHPLVPPLDQRERLLEPLPSHPVLKPRHKLPPHPPRGVVDGR